MAWRDSRSNRRKLFLYMAAIIVGVAAQVNHFIQSKSESEYQ